MILGQKSFLQFQFWPFQEIFALNSKKIKEKQQSEGRQSLRNCLISGQNLRLKARKLKEKIWSSQESTTRLTKDSYFLSYEPIVVIISQKPCEFQNANQLSFYTLFINCFLIKKGCALTSSFEFLFKTVFLKKVGRKTFHR